MKISKVLLCQVALIAISVSAFAAESYSNFPTITADFKTADTCQSWLSEKTAKYGSRMISAASGCDAVQVRVFGSGSVHAPQYSTKIVGTVVLDTL